MYSITTTPGFIIESRTTGEAGRLLSIFTRELGLVKASAQGIRLEKSKLRYHSQEFSVGDFAFVRGKDLWRITNAEYYMNLRPFSDYQQEVQDLIVRIALILRRLLHGEEPHSELFERIESFFIFISSMQSFSAEHVKTLESVMMYRILYTLGYIGTDQKLESRISGTDLTVFFLDEIAGQRTAMNAHINKALRESHL